MFRIAPIVLAASLCTLAPAQAVDLAGQKSTTKQEPSANGAARSAPENGSEPIASAMVNADAAAADVQPKPVDKPLPFAVAELQLSVSDAGLHASIHGPQAGFVGVLGLSLTWKLTHPIADLPPLLADAVVVAYGFTKTQDLALTVPFQHVRQNCGQTWLNTFSEIAKYYNASNQLESLQIVTWNDYEEGSSIESGIDNCVSVSASVSGSTLNWSISGGLENTIDHYTVFISTDGQNLMKVAEVPAATRTLNLANFNFNAGAYKLHVKAVGKPSITNKMSNGASINLDTPPPAANQPPLASVSLSPGSGTAPLAVTVSTAASRDPDGSIVSSKIDCGDGSPLENGPTHLHRYSTPGAYTVTALITDNAGATSTTSATVSVSAAAYGISISSPADGVSVASPVRVVASATAAAGIDGMEVYVDSVQKFEGPVSSVDLSIAMSAGTHRITVKGWDKKGGVTSQAVTVTTTANTAPVAALSVTPTSGAAPLTVTASTAGSHDPDGSIAATRLEFGDGSVVNAASGSRTYNTPGAYTVKATVTDNAGATATKSVTVTVTAATTSYGVKISSPANGATVTSPVRVVASATAAAGIAGMEVYVDSVQKYEGAVSSLDLSIPMAAGSRQILVKGWDKAGGVTSSTVTINVQESATATGITVATPAEGATVSSPVRITASAVGNAPIDSMGVYVDSKLEYTVKGAAMDTSINMNKGAQYVVVQAWDVNGASYKKTLNITVQ